MTDVVLELCEVTKVYGSGDVAVRAVDTLDLKIHKGEFAALCGPSGSGKSTALNMMGALDTPTSGKVLIRGQDVGTMSRRQRAHLRRDQIGFVFQAYNLFPVLTVLENAEFTLQLQGHSKVACRTLAMKAIEQVGLSGLEHRRPHELSGGQMQRVAIARSLAPNPAIIIADEPSANLDSKTTDQLLDLMKEMNERQGATFVISTHDPQVMKKAARIIQLKDGKLQSTGGPS